ncbi:MAG: DUF3667 domain-containing protein, partial [Planctomycetota bacterium]
QRLNLRRRASISELTGEALQNLLQIDGKFLTTMRLLMIAPGKLSHEFYIGRRVRYISPVTLFMLVAGLMFLLVEWNASQPVQSEDVITRNKSSITVNLMPGFNLNFVQRDKNLMQLSPEELDQYLQEELKVKRGDFGYFISERALTLMQKNKVHEFRQSLAAMTYRSIALLIPMMAFLIVIFHYRQALRFADAAVYCLHLHCVFFLVGILLLVLPNSAMRDYTMLVLALPLVAYSARSLQIAFGNSWYIAWFKAIVILLLHGSAVVVLTSLLSLWIIVSI